MNQTAKELIQFHEAMTERLGKLELTVDFPQFFYQTFHEGEKKLYQKDSEEIKKFDDIWLETIESYFPSLDRITRQAKTVLRHDRELTAVERAKKIGPEAVRHLASHSQHVKEVTRDNVIPKNVLNVETNIEFATYENRMIATLIRRLREILTRRHDIIKESVEEQTKRHFNLDATFKADPLDVKMTIDLITVQEGSGDEETSHNEQILKRIKYLQKMIAVMEKSEFMRDLKDAKPVTAPLMKTQIILKNVDYNNGYLLWLYLDQHTDLPFARDVKERNLTFDEKYLSNIYQTALIVFTQIIANQKHLDYLYKDIELRRYKQPAPKVIRRLPETTLDDVPMVEDARINQYYLEQALKHFQENLDTHMEEASTYEVALKRALRDTIAITNALYESYFKFESEGDKDVFRYLVKIDLDQQLTEAKHKARVARIIRETKEVDYKDAIRLEKRQLKQVADLNKRLLNEKKQDVVDAAREAKLDEEKRLEIEHAQANAKLLTEHQDYVKAQNEAMQDDHKKLRENLDKAQKQFEAYEVKEMAKALEAGRKAFEKAQKEFEEKLAKEKAAWAEKLKQQKLASAATLKAEKERLKAEADASVNQEKAKLKSQLEDTKKTHTEELEASRRTLQAQTEQAIETLQAEQEKALVAQIKDVEHETEQRLATVRKQAAEALEEERKTYEFELEKVRLVEEDRLKKFRADLEQHRKDTLRKTKDMHKQKVQSETDTLNARLIQDKEAYEADIEAQRTALRETYRLKQETLKQEHDDALAKTLATMKADAESKLSEHKQKITEQFNRFKTNQDTAHKSEHTVLEQQYTETRQKLEQDFQAQKRAIYEKLQRYHAEESRRHEHALLALKEDTEKTLERDLEAFLTKQTTQLQALKTQHAATLKKLKEEAMRAYTEEQTIRSDEWYDIAEREKVLRRLAIEHVQALLEK